MTPVVVDCSVTMAWFFEDEVSPYTEAVLDAVGASSGATPALWALEVSNALATVLRKKTFATERLAEVQVKLQRLHWEIEPLELARSLGPVLALAQKHGLTSYDATYLEMAKRRELPLATLDKELAAAAKRERVKLFKAP